MNTVFIKYATSKFLFLNLNWVFFKANTGFTRLKLLMKIYIKFFLNSNLRLWRNSHALTSLPAESGYSSSTFPANWLVCLNFERANFPLSCVNGPPSVLPNTAWSRLHFPPHPPTPPRDPAFYAHVTDKEHLLLFTKVSNTIFPKARTLRKNFPQAIITVKNEKEQVKKNRKNYEIYEFVYKLSW